MRVFWISAIVAAIIFCTQCTIFVVQPIGAIPEGRTLIVLRQGQLKFIDSADAICARIQGGVSLLCRGATLGSVAQNTTILARLPYSETLYLWSTDGKVYTHSRL